MQRTRHMQVNLYRTTAAILVVLFLTGCGALTGAAIGAGVGYGGGIIEPEDVENPLDTNSLDEAIKKADQKSAIAGALAGFLIGAAVDMIRDGATLGDLIGAAGKGVEEAARQTSESSIYKSPSNPDYQVRGTPSSSANEGNGNKIEDAQVKTQASTNKCKARETTTTVCIFSRGNSQSSYEENARKLRAEFSDKLSRLSPNATINWTDNWCVHHPNNRDQGRCYIGADIQNICTLPNQHENWQMGEWVFRRECSEYKSGNAPDEIVYDLEY